MALSLLSLLLIMAPIQALCEWLIMCCENMYSFRFTCTQRSFQFYFISDWAHQFWAILDVVQLDVWDEYFIYCSWLSLMYTCCESWSWFLHLAALPNGCPPIIRLNIFPWVQNFYTVAMPVSNSFSFNVKSIVIYYVWNAKLNLFIFFVNYGYWDECPEGCNLLSTPPLYVSANTD